MKKYISIFLLLSVLLTLFPNQLVSAETSGIFTYSISNNHVTITRCNKSTSGSIEIPAKIDGFYVTCIGDYAFSGCSSLSSITIPNSVISIYYGAFYDCSSLSSITIPTSVTSIGNCAFESCSSLSSITIPNSVTDIGERAFSGCISLASITIPYNVTSIGHWAFKGCKNLTSITVDDSNQWFSSQNGVLFNKPKTALITYPCGKSGIYSIPVNVTYIVDNAFSDCSSLSSITIPNSVTSIGNNAFASCSSLTSITIPNSVTSIGESAFSDCTSLSSIILPNSVTSIGSVAFSECTSLSSITIPSNVTSIGEYAFQSCSSLSSMIIPNSVKSIGHSSFADCDNLTSITVDVNNQYYSSQNGVLFNKFKTELIIYPCGKSDSYSIPNSVTIICDEAFHSCTYLSSITIPNGITSIGFDAFSGCSSLSSITIPNSVTSIGYGVLANCENLTSIAVDVGNQSYLSQNGALLNRSKTELIAYPGCKSGAYSIPDSVTYIADEAFSGCSLSSITIPNGVRSIPDMAFSDCTSLSSIVIPNSIKVIGYRTFFNCCSLSSITIPNSVIEISNDAFEGCDKLILRVYNYSFAQYYFQSKSINYIVIPSENSVLITDEPTDQNGAVITKGNLQNITEVHLQIQKIPLLAADLKNPALFVAFYDGNNKLLNMSPYNNPLQDGENTIQIGSVPSSAVKMKIFCWDSFDTMYNLMVPYEI